MESLDEFKERLEIMKAVPYELQGYFSKYGTATTKLLILKEKAYVIFYDMTSVKAVDYTRLKGNYNKSASDERYYKLSEQLEELEKQQEFYKEYLDNTEKLLTTIHDKTLRENIYKAFIGYYKNEYDKLVKEFSY